MGLELTLLGIILDAILAGILAVYVIWDHVKDDVLLTRQVQEFYNDIEHLIFNFYSNQIANELKELYRGSIELDIPNGQPYRGSIELDIPIQQYQELNEYANRHYYYMVKVKTKFNDFSKYLGLIASEEVIGERMEYINETLILLNETGALNKRIDEIRIRIIKNYSDVEKGINVIITYLSSLRNFWNKSFHKFLIKGKLKPSIDFKKNFLTFIQDINKILKPVSKEEYFTKGNLAYYTENYSEAIKLFNQALDIDNKYIDAWIGKGGSYIKLNNYKASEDSLNKVIEIDPGNADAWYHKAIISAQANDLDTSIEYLEKAFETDKYYIKMAKKEPYFHDLRNLPQFKEKIAIYVYFSFSIVDMTDLKITEIANKLTSYDEIEEIIYNTQDLIRNPLDFLEESVGFADILVLFATPNSAKSQYVRNEWEFFRREQKPIIPVFNNVNTIPPLLRSRGGVLYDEFNIEEIAKNIHALILKKIRSF